MPLEAARIVFPILTVVIIVSCMPHVCSCIFHVCHKPFKEECNQTSEMDRSEDASFQQPNTVIHMTPQIDVRVMDIFHLYYGEYIDIIS